MNRNVEYLIPHSIFKQDAFGIPIDVLPVLCQIHQQTVAVVYLTASKAVIKGIPNQHKTENLVKEAAGLKPMSESKERISSASLWSEVDRHMRSYSPSAIHRVLEVNATTQCITWSHVHYRISQFPTQNLKTCSARMEGMMHQKKNNNNKGRRNPTNRGRQCHSIIQRGSAETAFGCETCWKIEVGIST